MRDRTIERLSQHPDALELWVLQWIIRHYNITVEAIAGEMGYSTQYVGQMLLGQHPARLDDLDLAIYNLTRGVVCCQARGDMGDYLRAET